MTMPTMQYVTAQAIAYFEAVGLDVTVSDETVHLEGGGEFGLSGLTRRLADVPADHWADAITEHFDRLMATPEPAEIEAMLADWELVHARVEAHAIGEHERDLFGPGVLVEREIAPGLGERLNLALGDGAYASVKAEIAAGWPVHRHLVWLEARSNARRTQPAQEVTVPGHPEVKATFGRAALATVTAENPGPYGQFLTVPERDRVLSLSVRSNASLEAAIEMLGISLAFHGESDRPVSPNLYWQATTGKVVVIASPSEDRFHYHRQPEFSAMCWELEAASKR